jgi:Tol biopolymer transport system component
VTGKRLAYFSGTTNLGIWSLPIDPFAGTVKGQSEMLNLGLSDCSTPSVSTGGSVLAYLCTPARNPRVWLKEFATAAERSIDVPLHSGDPEVSPDGLRVAFRVMEGTREAVLLASAKNGRSERICEHCGAPTGWSPDGRRLLIETGHPLRKLAVLDLAGRTPHVILSHPTMGLHLGRFSPDGRWIAFHADVGPHVRRIMVTRYRGEVEHPVGDWITTTPDMAINQEPCWSPDGNRLYFLTERDGFRCIAVQRLDPSSKQPVGPPFTVHHLHSARRSMTLLGGQKLAQVGLSIAGDKLVFSLVETAGDVWMADLKD